MRITRKTFVAAVLGFLGSLAVCPAQSPPEKPYVLLISLDGFRYDYAERFGAKNLLALGRRGVVAKAMLPSYPSTTFPNHYTIVTGMYPEHHGIVENGFWDPNLKARFLFSDSNLNSDPRFWGGTPLWVLAEKQGVKSASFFWPGSDVEIQGTRPSIYHPYDSKITNDDRVKEVASWLQLPPEKRPHFMTLYFSDVDHEGHSFGPDAPETAAAVQVVDKALGDLLARIDASGVAVNVFVVSDHGMVKLQGTVDLSTLAKFDDVKVVGGGNQVKVYSDDPAKIDALFKSLKAALVKTPDDRIDVYKQADIPARLHYSGNPRIGDLVILSQKPVSLVVPDPTRPARPNGDRMRSTHGFDVSQVPEMRGIFYAAGPNVRAGVAIEEFENIHMYPLIAKILGLRITERIDGDLDVLTPILK